MRTITDYLDWMKKVDEIDPRLEHLFYHNLRSQEFHECDTRGFPKEPTEVENALYRGSENPGELRTLDNSVLYINALPEEIEKLARTNGFELRELVGDSVDKSVGLNLGGRRVSARERYFSHTEAPVLLRTFHSIYQPYSLKQIIVDGTRTLEEKEMFEEATEQNADIIVTASLWINGGGGWGYDTKRGLSARIEEAERKVDAVPSSFGVDSVSERVTKRLMMLVGPLLQTIVDKNVPAILTYKQRTHAVANLPSY